MIFGLVADGGTALAEAPPELVEAAELHGARVKDGMRFVFASQSSRMS